MQTFLPLPSMLDSAETLDRQRLGKQRVECLQILRSLSGLTKGWQNHPATKMWRGHEHALADYSVIVCEVWIERGYKDTCRDKIEAMRVDHASQWGLGLPPWWGDERLHASHRSNLIRKFPEHYAPQWPSDPDDLDYYWPAERDSQ